MTKIPSPETDLTREEELLSRYDQERQAGDYAGARDWMAGLPDDDFNRVVRGLNRRVHTKSISA